MTVVSGLQRRGVRVDADAIVDDAIALQQHVARFFQTDAVAAGAAVVGEQVAPQLRSRCRTSHRCRPSCCGRYSPRSGDGRTASSAARSGPSAKSLPRTMLSGEYQRMASRVSRMTLSSISVRGLYQILSPSPRREIGRSMPSNRVAAHDAVSRLLQVDAEERVLDAVVLDHGVGAPTANASVLAVERVAGAAHDKAAHRHVRRRDADHVAAAVALDHRPLLAVQRQRLVDE